MLKKINQSVNYIHSIIKGQPKTAIVLGTGLSKFKSEVSVLKEISYDCIPNFPKTSVEGHKGKLIHALHKGSEILIMQGRSHFYEGLSMEDLVYPIRVLKYLGIENLILSNAAGGLDENYAIGDIVLITDHINLMPNPLIGPHIAEFGERFPDMSLVYDPVLIQKANEIAKTNKLKIHNGVYVAVTGPTYETPAEYKYLRIIGADVVGMSTVPEVIVARQMNIKCFAMSVVTDLGVMGRIEYLTHEMVQKAAEEAEPRMAVIVKELLEVLNNNENFND